MATLLLYTRFKKVSIILLRHYVTIFADSNITIEKYPVLICAVRAFWIHTLMTICRILKLS